MYLNLTTDRLTLRPIELGDAEFMMQLVNSEGWLRFIGDRQISSHSKAENYIEDILHRSDFYYSVFQLKHSIIPIGIVSFIKRENEILPDIGFAILPDYSKNGYAYEATKAYIEELKRQNPVIKEILAITKSDNESSMRLIQKLGFLYQKEEVKNGERFNYYYFNLR